MPRYVLFAILIVLAATLFAVGAGPVVTAKNAISVGPAQAAGAIDYSTFRADYEAQISLLLNRLPGTKDDTEASCALIAEAAQRLESRYPEFWFGDNCDEIADSLFEPAMLFGLNVDEAFSAASERAERTPEPMSRATPEATATLNAIDANATRLAAMPTPDLTSAETAVLWITLWNNESGALKMSVISALAVEEYELVVYANGDKYRNANQLPASREREMTGWSDYGHAEISHVYAVRDKLGSEKQFRCERNVLSSKEKSVFACDIVWE